MFEIELFLLQKCLKALLAGVAEFIDCFPVEGWDSSIESLGYDIKQTNGEASVMLELWEMQNTFSLLLLLGPLWTWVVVPDKVLSMGQIELFDI